MEKCWDILGRDNPKFVKVKNAISSSASSASSSQLSLEPMVKEKYTPVSISGASYCDSVNQQSCSPHIISGTSKRSASMATIDIHSESSKKIAFTARQDSPQIVKTDTNAVFAHLLEGEAKNNEEIHKLKITLLNAKIEAQKAKRDYYLSKT